MVPNLGYKKDAFLEPSLISNSLTNIPIITIQQLCLLLTAPTNKLVAIPIRVLLRHHHPVVRLHGRTAFFMKGLNCYKSIGLLAGKYYPDLTNNRPT